MGYVLTPLEAKVYSAIPSGSRNAVTRRELSETLDMDDRVIRRTIENLNTKQHIVCNLLDGRGYFKPEIEAEAVAYEKITNSYKCAAARKEYAIKRGRRRLFGGGEDLPEEGVKRRSKRFVNRNRGCVSK